MSQQHVISVTGLGYVGLAVATAFAKHYNVIAYDINATRVAQLKQGLDTNKEVAKSDMQATSLHYVNNVEVLKEANFHIVAVPTLINTNRQPDLSALIKASTALGNIIKKGDTVVYESSVYIGATEEICIPALEKSSGLTCGRDFYVGFSPERINPADKVHDFSHITKIVAGFNQASLTIIAGVYQKVITAELFLASSIRVAEATKIIENTQRDINIGYLNEMALLLHKLNMDSREVLAAMKTKWNALNFTPGLVGGHCINNNAFYLLYQGQQAHYIPEIIAASRKTNEYIPRYIAQQTMQQLQQQGKPIAGAKIAILGFSFKENYAGFQDIGSDNKAVIIYDELIKNNATVLIHDPFLEANHTKEVQGIEFVTWQQLNNLDAIIITVAHQFYKELSKQQVTSILSQDGLIFDIKHIINPADFLNTNITIWSL